MSSLLRKNWFWWANSALTVVLIVLVFFYLRQHGEAMRLDALSDGRINTLALNETTIETAELPDKAAQSDETATAQNISPDTTTNAKPVRADAPPLPLYAPSLLTNGGLSPAPNPKLIDRYQDKELPIAEDGITPWQSYARPVPIPSTPKIAIVITGIGLHNTISEESLSLNPNISMSISPYAKNPEIWAKAARSNGHEILLDLPLETADYPATDPGPMALLAEYPAGEILRKLYNLMALFPGYIGGVTQRNDVVLSNNQAAQPIMKEFKKRGVLLMLDHNTIPATTAELITQTNVPYVSADILLDTSLRPEAIRKKFTELETIAKTQGFAVATLHPYPLTLTELTNWLNTLPSKDLALVPLSTIARITNADTQ